jgi:Subtilase family
MVEQGMKWYFEPRRDDDGAGHDDDGAGRDGEGPAPGLASLPAALLQRHGAVALDPGSAARIPATQGLGPTFYRARTLLVPGSVLRQGAMVDAINGVLDGVGMRLRPLGPGRDGDDGILAELPRPALLEPAGPRDDMTARPPVVINAWVALQALRAAVTGRDDQALDGAAAGPLDPDVVSRITLDHLLIGSAISGSPAGSHGGGLQGGSDDGSSTGSYLYPGGDSRAPVAVALPRPRRKPADQCRSDYGRRPVVAVLDTGVRAHPWLDVEPDKAGGYTIAHDGFVAIDEYMQHVIYDRGEEAIAAGDRPRLLITGPWDGPVTENPLLGELATDEGHGSFIAGIVRQVSPDAQVLAVRIMHSDGVVTESDLICALGLLAERVAAAEEGDPAAMVDVVSLSLGYFDESADDVSFSSGLWQAIQLLLGLGVAVVAAAGNYATSRRFYPAAFADQAQPAVPLISVGALNPNGTQALFSDSGRWVKAWAMGAAVVSTYPEDINASREPGNEMPGREGLDPDDYRGGFAVWSGTSFSAPLLAAHIARSLMEGAADPALRLDVPGQQAATGRAVAALSNLGWPG